MKYQIPVDTIAAFSAVGRVHRAFGHLIAAAHGALLCVPVAIATGDLRQVVDSCPVPWDEVFAVIDQPLINPLPTPLDRFMGFNPPPEPLLSLGWTDGWVIDVIAIRPGDRANVRRLSHCSGLCFANV